MNAKPFLDTNILIYAFALQDRRSEKAEALLALGGIISVQVLNEFVNVSRRKLNRSWPQIDSALAIFRTLLDPPIPLTVELNSAAVVLARNHALGFYDSLIIAAARHANCALVYSEDMQDGQKIGATMIRDPFAP